MSDRRLRRIEEHFRPEPPAEQEPPPGGPLAHLTDAELRQAEAALVRKLADEIRAGRSTLDGAAARLGLAQRRHLEGLVAGDLATRCPACFQAEHVPGSRPHQIGRGAGAIAPEWPYSWAVRERVEREGT